MNRLRLAAAIIMFSLLNANAQETSFGATLGYHNLIVTASFEGISSSDGQSGLFIGLFADLSISDKFHIQPELHYATVFANGESLDELILPVMVKYYLEDKFFLQAGLNFDYILEESVGVEKFGFGLAFGAGYDFTDKLFATSRYSLGLNNRLDDNLFLNDDLGGSISFETLKTKFNFFQIGIGYRFN